MLPQCHTPCSTSHVGTGTSSWDLRLAAVRTTSRPTSQKILSTPTAWDKLILLLQRFPAYFCRLLFRHFCLLRSVSLHQRGISLPLTFVKLLAWICNKSNTCLNLSSEVLFHCITPSFIYPFIISLSTCHVMERSDVCQMLLCYGNSSMNYA